MSLILIPNTNYDFKTEFNNSLQTEGESNYSDSLEDGATEGDLQNLISVSGIQKHCRKTDKRDTRKFIDLFTCNIAKCIECSFMQNNTTRQVYHYQVK